MKVNILVLNVIVRSTTSATDRCELSHWMIQAIIVNIKLVPVNAPDFSLETPDMESLIATLCLQLVTC